MNASSSKAFQEKVLLISIALRKVSIFKSFLTLLREHGNISLLKLN
jgi:hypothetical protein